MILLPQYSHLFKKRSYTKLTNEERLLFINMPVDYMDDDFRLMTYLANNKRCMITEDYLDLNKTFENTSKQDPRYGSWLSIEHIKAQSQNINSNYIGNLIPIKGTINSSIGTHTTDDYLKNELGWDEEQFDIYYDRINVYRDNLFAEMKKYFQNNLLVKYNLEKVKKIFDAYSISSWTGYLTTYEALAEEFGTEGVNPKKEVRQIARAFEIDINKSKKVDACFDIKYDEIKSLLKAGMTIQNISDKYKVKFKDLQTLILESDLKEFTDVEVAENRVIRVCEENREDMLSMYDQTQNVNEILRKYNLHRDHGTVKMFIHMALLNRNIELEMQRLKTLSEKTGQFKGLIEMLGNVEVGVLKFTKDNTKNEMKLKLKFEEIK